MAGEDVRVTIGGDLSPIQRTFAQVKAQAKESAEGIGIEFDRGAQRAEQRVQRGMDGVIRSILSAKNPIEAVSGALESLSRGFAIASTAFLAIGVVAELYKAFTEAQEASEKLTASIEKLSEVNADNESIHQLQRDIDDFQKIEEKYNDRGMLEKILFGPQEDVDFAKAANLNELKKNLLSVKQIEEENIKLQARLLEASDNPEDKRKAKVLRKSIADSDEKGEIAAQIDDAQKEGDELVDKLQEQQQKIDEFNRHKEGRVAAGVATPADIAREQKDLEDEYDGIVKTMEQNDKKVASLRENQALLAKDQAAEAEQAEKEDAKEKKEGANVPAEREASKVKAEMEKQAKIKQDAAEVGLTGEQKAAVLKKKIADDQKSADNFTGPKQQSQILEEQNRLLEDQLALKKQIAENDKAIAEKLAEVKRQQETKAKQDQTDKARVTALKQDQAVAKADLATAQANAMGAGHPIVTSLRREGFGKTPAATKDGAAQKALQASEKHLNDINKGIDELNKKIGGAA